VREEYLFDLGLLDEDPLQQKHLLAVGDLVVLVVALQQNPLPFPPLLLRHPLPTNVYNQN
jgi:hypothetical protein